MSGVLPTIAVGIRQLACVVELQNDFSRRFGPGRDHTLHRASLAHRDRSQDLFGSIAACLPHRCALEWSHRFASLVWSSVFVFRIGTYRWLLCVWMNTHARHVSLSWRFPNITLSTQPLCDPYPRRWTEILNLFGYDEACFDSVSRWDGNPPSQHCWVEVLCIEPSYRWGLRTLQTTSGVKRQRIQYDYWTRGQVYVDW